MLLKLAFLSEKKKHEAAVPDFIPFITQFLILRHKNTVKSKNKKEMTVKNKEKNEKTRNIQ